MTTVHILRLLGDLIQFVLGACVMVFGFKMAYRRWDRTELDYHVGLTLAVLGAIIIFLLRRAM